ncbi:hypothetical protein [[Clostridium] symbiosum]|uniref:hypothetical protein n=1 Tax=Clostridium symbiosum TaxID=1512 RepID=UPI00321AC51C
MEMRKQRLMGLCMVAISFAILALASTGKTPEDRDATAILFTLPLGIYMMVTKDYVLYGGEEETDSEPNYTTEMKGAAKWQENELQKPQRSSPGRKSMQLSGRSLRPSSHWEILRPR